MCIRDRTLTLWHIWQQDWIPRRGVILTEILALDLPEVRGHDLVAEVPDLSVAEEWLVLLSSGAILVDREGDRVTKLGILILNRNNIWTSLDDSFVFWRLIVVLCLLGLSSCICACACPILEKVTLSLSNKVRGLITEKVYWVPPTDTETMLALLRLHLEPKSSSCYFSLQ